MTLYSFLGWLYCGVLVSCSTLITIRSLMLGKCMCLLSSELLSAACMVSSTNAHDGKHLFTEISLSLRLQITEFHPFLTFLHHNAVELTKTAAISVFSHEREREMHCTYKLHWGRVKLWCARPSQWCNVCKFSDNPVRGKLPLFCKGWFVLFASGNELCFVLLWKTML